MLPEQTDERCEKVWDEIRRSVWSKRKGTKIRMD